jgi:hypothetical protein
MTRGPTPCGASMESLYPYSGPIAWYALRQGTPYGLWRRRMEACTGAHHLSRKLQALGHDARLMPTNYVRPYSKGDKNDYRDAEAIAEAVQRPTMKFVATKTADQLDLQPCIGCGAVAAILSGMLRFEHTGMGHGASQQNWQPMSAWGQKHALPRRCIAVRFTPVSGIDSRSQGLPSRANCGLMQRNKQHRYSITSSARPSNVIGNVRPSAFAVSRLMTSSTLVDCWTGKSAGFSPLRMRPTQVPTRRYKWARLVP